MIGPDGTLATATTTTTKGKIWHFLPFRRNCRQRDNKAERVKTVVSSTTDFRNVNHL